MSANHVTGYTPPFELNRALQDASIHARSSLDNILLVSWVILLILGRLWLIGDHMGYGRREKMLDPLCVSQQK